MVYLFGPYFFRKKMATTFAARVARGEPMSQPETDSDSDSDNEDFSDAPNMEDYISAKAQLADMNLQRKELLETLKRKADQLEDYMIAKKTNFVRLEGLVAQRKRAKKLSWSEKSLREHADEDGKLDIDMYKSNQTEIVERMSIKLE